MWKSIILSAAMAGAIAASPAFAQQPSPGEMPADKMEQGQAASQYKGWPVFGSGGEKIGEVVEARMGADGKPEALHVEAAQELGIGTKTIEVQKDQFQAGDNRIELKISSDEAKSLPEAQKN